MPPGRGAPGAGFAGKSAVPALQYKINVMQTVNGRRGYHFSGRMPPLRIGPTPPQHKNGMVKQTQPCHAKQTYHP